MREKFAQDCMVCGHKLEYLDHPVLGECVYCGTTEQSYFKCPDGHFVCNSCHAKDALIKMTKYCLNSTSTSPMDMLEELMADQSFAMHGPEHHAVVPAVLVTAYHNKTGKLDDSAIVEAIKRGSQIPGGYCGIYGACGAGIGTGVAVAVITSSTPLTPEPRALSNMMTSKALKGIAELGGARCCKASSRVAVEIAAEFFREYLECEMDTPVRPRCSHMKRNSECNLTHCHYFPTVVSSKDKPEGLPAKGISI